MQIPDNKFKNVNNNYNSDKIRMFELAIFPCASLFISYNKMSSTVAMSN